MSHPLRDFDRVSAVALIKIAKFFAAKSGNKPIIHRGARNLANIGQYTVSYFMPVGIIDAFEVINIEKDGGKRFVNVSSSVYLGSLFEKCAAIKEAGQGIGHRKSDERMLHGGHSIGGAQSSA